MEGSCDLTQLFPEPPLAFSMQFPIGTVMFISNAPLKIYVGISVYRGKITQVKLLRTETDADRFVRSFESTYGIRTSRERKHQREANDIYADCYEFTL